MELQGPLEPFFLQNKEKVGVKGLGKSFRSDEMGSFLVYELSSEILNSFSGH
jgi:hypothetical protein